MPRTTNISRGHALRGQAQQRLDWTVEAAQRLITATLRHGCGARGTRPCIAPFNRHSYMRAFALPRRTHILHDLVGNNVDVTHGIDVPRKFD